MKMLLKLAVLSAWIVLSTGCACWHDRNVSEHTVSANKEQWRDEHGLEVNGVLTDSKADEITISFTNQTALGGSSSITIKRAEMSTSSNAPAFISSIGTLVGKAATGAVSP
jgi:hypothetical protein